MPKLNSFSAGSAIGLTGNTTLSGGIPIWQNQEVARTFTFQGGFALQNTPDSDALVPGGTPLECDELNRTAKICYMFEVYEAATSSPVQYKIKKDSGIFNLLSVGMNVMKYPAAVATAGAGYAISAIDTSNEAYDLITVPTTLGDVAAGDVFAEADSAHATTAKLEAVPNALSYHDMFVEDDNLGYSADGVYQGSIYNRRIRKITAVAKAEMPLINFSESK